jgi:LysM repeat protein
METGHRSPLRSLAPLALVVFGIAFVLVVATSGGGGDEGGSSTGAAEEARDLGTNAKDDTQSKRAETTEDESEEELGDDVYIVKRGDTLGGIAEETGVPVERLEELNPGLDQFSLVAGQRIKLR